MRGAGRHVPTLFEIVGVALVLYALVSGRAHLYLVLILPVLTGVDPVFLIGVLFLFLGLFWDFLGFFSTELPTPAGVPSSSNGRGDSPDDPPHSISGGVVLIGPIPILFGSARRMSRKTYLSLMIVGSAVLVGALLAYLAL